MFVRVVLLVTMLGFGHAVTASEITWSPEVERWVPDAKVVGSTRYSYLFWDVYDATLVAPDGNWSSEMPYALALRYLRDFDGADIAERSIKEIKRQGVSDRLLLDEWDRKLKQIFPDVTPDTVLTGVLTANGTARFYLGEQHLGSLEDPRFAKYFFAIWLGENTSEPQARDELLGVK